MAKKKGELPLREHLRRLAGWTVVGPVLVEHNNEASYVLSADGSRWIGKAVEVTGEPQFFAEAFAYQLAGQLQLPVPQGAYGGEGQGLIWFSGCVANVSHYHPGRLPLTNHQADFGRALALDVWLLNEDRHAGNILLEAGGGLFRPWFIDFGSAVVGHIRDYEQRIDDVPREGQFAARGVAPELLTEGALTSLEDIAALPEGDIRGAIHDACLLVGFGATEERVCQAVLKRRSGLPALVRSFLARLGISS